MKYFASPQQTPQSLPSTLERINILDGIPSPQGHLVEDLFPFSPPGGEMGCSRDSVLESLVSVMDPLLCLRVLLFFAALSKTHFQCPSIHCQSWLLVAMVVVVMRLEMVVVG